VRGQSHLPGLYWSVTTGGHVVYESRLELARLLVADFDAEVVGIAAPRQHRRSGSLPYPGNAALVQGATAPQPAQAPELGADEPPRDTMATARPIPASLPRRTVQRHYPRQEPSAVVPLAGICAGGRPQGRSLPRPFRRCAGFSPRPAEELHRSPSVVSNRPTTAMIFRITDRHDGWSVSIDIGFP
jgi:hypothetical protein